MGYVYGHNIKPVGDYLLKILAEKGTVRYGEEFYDGTDEQEQKLREALGIGPEVNYENDQVYPPIYADWAAGQLEHAEIVETRLLDEALSDGEPDYEITLTEKGRKFLAAGREFTYRDMDL